MTDSGSENDSKGAYKSDPESDEGGAIDASGQGKSSSDLSDVEQKLLLQLRERSASGSGPLPHPEHLRAFGDLDASFPPRIFDYVEREQNHRHQIEARCIDVAWQSRALAAKKERAGQLIAVPLIVLLVGIGATLTLLGHAAVGGIIFSTTIISIAALFITGQIVISRREHGDNDKS